MKRRRSTVKKDTPFFQHELDVASPPEPSKNNGFRHVHEEIVMLANVGRVFLGVAMEIAGGGVPASWSKFVTEPTPHRKISTPDEIKHFLSAKLSNRRSSRS